jgi:hypothetical protein
MPEGRWGHRTVSLGGRLFVVGGEGPSSRVLIFSEEEGWSAGAELPVPRDHLAVVVHGGEIWAIGGRNGDGEPSGMMTAMAQRWSTVWGRDDSYTCAVFERPRNG